jgi:hypothetical protein
MTGCGEVQLLQREEGELLLRLSEYARQLGELHLDWTPTMCLKRAAERSPVLAEKFLDIRGQLERLGVAVRPFP